MLQLSVACPPLTTRQQPYRVLLGGPTETTEILARQWDHIFYTGQSLSSEKVRREGTPPKKPPTQRKTVCTTGLHKLFLLVSACCSLLYREKWETDFYTPPVLGGVAFFCDNSAPAVYKIQGPQGTGFLYTAGAELSERATPPSTGGV